MDLKEYYNFADKDGHPSYLRHPWETARAEIAVGLLSCIKFPVGASIIDIGCGDGYALRKISHALNAGSCLGIDVSLLPENIRKINYDFAKEGIDGYVSENFQKAYSFALAHEVGLMTFMDVIEHVKDPHRFLTDTVRGCRLARGTSVFITVPAFQSLFSFHDKYFGHYRRYSKKKLLELVKSCGFRTIDSGYFFTSLLLPRSVSLFKEKCLRLPGEVRHIGSWKHGKTISNAAVSVLLAEFKMEQFLKKVGISFPGLSIYCIAETA